MVSEIFLFIRKNLLFGETSLNNFAFLKDLADSFNTVAAEQYRDENSVCWTSVWHIGQEADWGAAMPEI
jgi:hypothetical protein